MLVLPYINMNPPQVYTCSPSRTPLPPPSPYHPSGSSQCTSPKHPVILHRTQIGDLFHIWYYTCFNAILPKKCQGWSPSEWTGWISLQSKGLSRVFSNTTVQKHQFYIWISSNEVDETGAYYTEWSKPERKTPIQYTNAYIWNLERW